jgi:hypothetical protein
MECLLQMLVWKNWKKSELKIPNDKSQITKKTNNKF